MEEEETEAAGAEAEGRRGGERTTCFLLTRKGERVRDEDVAAIDGDDDDNDDDSDEEEELVDRVTTVFADGDGEAILLLFF